MQNLSNLTKIQTPIQTKMLILISTILGLGIAVSLFTSCNMGVVESSADWYSPNTMYEDSYTKGTNDYYPGEEQFEDYGINPFVETSQDALSTFSVDVDTGSYTWGRHMIEYSNLPSPESVRVEEYINYFRQDYPYPTDAPFGATMDGAPSPFRQDYHILRIGIQGKDLTDNTRKPWNLTFLIDVSGSMGSRIAFVQDSLSILVDQMQQQDQISICTYAGSVRTVLEPTGIDGKATILSKIDELYTGGSTAMASGIVNAYNLNSSAFIQNGVNRVIVCSDGDANVGTTSFSDILDMIKDKVSQGTTLSTLGFGTGNYNDTMMEQLADNGNGNYYYIDSINEAERIFTEDLVGTMEVIAKDVKIQMEFNANTVSKYRLIGYENREIADEDFDDDQIDAGEIGAKHRVTALYEVELVSESTEDLGTCYIRYKEPEGSTSKELEYAFPKSQLAASFDDASQKFRFTVSVAEFAEILRESNYTESTFTEVYDVMYAALAVPEDDREVECLDLVSSAITLAGE